MKRFFMISVILPFVVVLIGEVWAGEGIIVKREAAQKFTTLPAVANFPEGITANPDTGDIYVSTFEFDGSGNETNLLLRFKKNGKLIAKRDFGNIPLLGLAFNREDNKVYICSVGNFQGVDSKIQRIAADFDETTPIEDVAVIPNLVGPLDSRTVDNPDGSTDTIMFGLGAAVPNALTFNSAGDLFASDSFQGAVFRIDSADMCGDPGILCSVVTVKQDGLLTTAGFPPFGANGIALSTDESEIFIANTGDDRILRLNLGTGEIVVFAESINGADGIAYYEGQLVVAANQADEVVILNVNGRVIAKLGDFLGIRNDGSARGLLFPASLVIVGDRIFVTNLALPLTGVAGDEPEEDVSTYTVSRINIPKQLP
ncbi:MAG: hypothetical protein ACE5HC_11080 [Candidatus Binatia bacterium]